MNLQIGTALQTIATDMLAAIGSVAPVALSIVGAVLVWRFGVRFFKGLAK